MDFFLNHKNIIIVAAFYLQFFLIIYNKRLLEGNMNFGWLNFMKKRKIINKNTSEIATIDTSFIRVTNLSELNCESVIELNKILSKLDYNNYESIVKYSNELLNKSNYIRDYII